MKDRKKYLKRNNNRHRDEVPELALTVALAALALFGGAGNLCADHYEEGKPQQLQQIDAPFTDYEEVK